MTSLDSIASLALAHRETTEASYQMAADVIRRGIPGDFVECGVFAGAQCAAMAQAICTLVNVGPRKVHLFDTFTGIPEPGPEDVELRTVASHAGDAACSLEQVQQYMKMWGIPEELLVYHRGELGYVNGVACLRYDGEPRSDPWPDRIAVLRLDLDLYEGTKAAMERFFPLLSRGGWLIVDDWNLSGCRKAVDETCVLHPAYFQKL